MFRTLLTRSGAGVAVVTAVTGIALAAVGVIDYRATRTHLLDLLREQAETIRHTVAAAARANRAAAARAEAEMAARLLDNARLLAEIERTRPLRPELLQALTARNSLFRVTVYDAEGRREQVSLASGGGAPGGGQGFGGRLLQELLTGDVPETVTELHRSRWGDARLAAGVRRVSGGAIVLNADASAIAELQRPYSLDALVADMLASTGDLAYIVIEQAGERISRGDLAAAPVIDVRSAVDLGGSSLAMLRLGMRLDMVRETERQHAVRLAVSFSALLVLSAVTVGFFWLRTRYGDLSARHALAQETLRRRERLAAAGELAATVAHEIRNPLNAIAMSAQRLRHEFLPAVEACAPDRDELADLLQVVEKESARLDTRVQQFLDYARPPRLARDRVRLDALLTEVAEAGRALALGRDVTLDARFSGVLEATVDPLQLRQALDNIVRNAIEATAAGGAVRVRASREGRTVVIVVQDTGAGIPPEHLPRIFDLYFSTKRDGTGIGLAVAHQVIAAHGGTIEVESQPGRGTRMAVRIPDQENTRA